MTEEIQKAIDAGWVKIIPKPETDHEAGQTPRVVSLPGSADAATGSTPTVVSATRTTDAAKPASHDWVIDYSEVETGTITIRDESTGRSLSAEIAERKGEQHFTLKNFGTVKAQQWWPTAQALEKFDATE